jgi:hypothetical protein
MRLTVPGLEYLWLAPFAGYLAMILLTAVPDPSRVAAPPPHGRAGRTITNGGIALTVTGVELTELWSANRAVPTYGLDFTVTVQNRAWPDAAGFAFDQGSLSLEGTGTGWRRSGFRVCNGEPRLKHGESIDGAIQFVLDGALVGRPTLTLTSGRGTLARSDFNPPPARPIIAPLVAGGVAGGDQPLPPVACKE